MYNDEKILYVIPALSGYYVLTPCYDEGGGAICKASREPVIAWALDGLGSTIPVTPHEVLNGNDDHAILCPDGEVRSYDNGWENLADWLDEQHEALAARGQP